MSLLSEIPAFVINHVFYRAKLNDSLQSGEIKPENMKDSRRVVDIQDANIVSSFVGEVDGVRYHRPLLDIDLPVNLLPSTNNHHLYLDKILTEEQYVALLTALHEAGIIGKGNVSQMQVYGATTLRLPWIKKGDKNEQD